MVKLSVPNMACQTVMFPLTGCIGKLLEFSPYKNCISNLLCFVLGIDGITPCNVLTTSGCKDSKATVCDALNLAHSITW